MIVYGGFSHRQAENGCVVTECDALARESGFVHAFSTRLGGVSEGPYASMNLTVSSGDRVEHVRENFARLIAALPQKPSTVCHTHQVHRDRILTVTAANAADFAAEPPECDGLVTAEPDHLLVGKFADCVPILLADRRLGACAVVHAGWRGTAMRIAETGVRALQAAFGSQPADLIAAVGPAIGPCCFLTHNDVTDALLASCGALVAAQIAPADDGRSHVDLKRINAALLAQTGVEEIYVCPDCTCCLSELYHSHRRTGPVRGSMVAMIARNQF